MIERSVNRSELYMCDELFFCGSGAEIMPIGSVDRYTVGDGGVGPVTRKVQDHFKALMFGESDDHPEWRTPIYDGQ